MLPQHFAVAGCAREHAREHEQQVGKPVQVVRRLDAHRFEAAQRDDFALGTAADRTREMAMRRSDATAREDEILQRRQVFVEGVERVFEALDIGRMHHRHAGDAQFAAKVEQIVLHLGQHLAHAIG